MINDISAFLLKWSDSQQQQSQSYINVTIDCTAGQHHSLYIVERLTKSQLTL